MTIPYSHEVFTSAGSGIFLKLLFRWKGSIYKLVWHDLVIYITIYYFLSGLYRFVLDDTSKIIFENAAIYCGSFADLIPITFVLGFYVSLIVTRWWNMFETIPWPDSAAVWISTCIHGHDDRGRLMRRTIVRYINLSIILTLRFTSLPVKKRFPTLDHLVEAGILTENEKGILEKMDAHVTHCKYWMPLVWAGAIATRARKENRIKDDYALKSLIEQLDKFRSGSGGLLNYDWISLPLVYTQVVTLAVYTFLLATLMGHQFLDPSKGYQGHDVDLIVPVFTFLQFFFYMGWLKVAEALINPFGEDEDDFEMNWMIDRNLQVSYLIVDEMHAEHPELIRDQYWDDIFPELPYTAAAEPFRTEAPMGSACKYEVSDAGAEFLPMPHCDEEDEDDEDEDMEGEGEDEGDGGLIEIVVGGEKTEPLDITGIKVKGANGTRRKHRNKRFLKSNMSDSNSTLANTSNRSTRSSMTSLINKIFRGNSHSHLMPNGRMGHQGSSLSIFSKASKNSKASGAPGSVGTGGGGGHVRRKKRKSSKTLTARSISRISASSQPQSPTYNNMLHKDGINEDIFKMSSTSSLNSHVAPSESDFSTHPYNSKMDVNSDHKPIEMNSGRFMYKSTHMSNMKRKTIETHKENKILRQKLEAIQTLQSEIMCYLDDEIETGNKRFENGSNHQNSFSNDPSDVVHLLEERTQDLRRALLIRDHNTAETDLEMDNNNHDNNLLTETQPGSIDRTQPGSIQSLINPNNTIYPPEESFDDAGVAADPSEQQLVKVEQDFHPTTNLDSIIDNANDEVVVNPTSSKSIEIPHATGNIDNNESTEEISDEICVDPTNAEISLETEKETTSDSDNNTGFDIQLSTIEEQPELGYQSDSSETDFLIPLDKGGGSIYKKPKSCVPNQNLPPVPEESTNNH